MTDVLMLTIYEYAIDVARCAKWKRKMMYSYSYISNRMLNQLTNQLFFCFLSLKTLMFDEKSCQYLKTEDHILRNCSVPELDEFKCCKIDRFVITVSFRMQLGQKWQWEWYSGFSEWACQLKSTLLTRKRSIRILLYRKIVDPYLLNIDNLIQWLLL